MSRSHNGKIKKLNVDLNTSPPSTTNTEAGTSKQATNQSSPPIEKSTTYQEVLEVCTQTSTILKELSGALPFLVPLGVTFGLARSVLEITRSVNTNTEHWDSLREQMAERVTELNVRRSTFLEDRNGNVQAIEDGLENALGQYIANLEEVQSKIQNAVEKRTRGIIGFVRRIIRVHVEANAISQHKEDMNNITLAYLVSTNQWMGGLQVYLADTTALQSIPIAHVGWTELDRCLLGTRETILQQIREWQAGNGIKKRIFWICDVPGSGKSTVAATMAREWEDNGIVAPRFFFSGNDASTMRLSLFCSTIAKDLASRRPEILPIVAKAFREDVALSTKQFAHQFQKLFVEPLQASTRDIILIIDALDQCVAPARGQLIQALVELLPLIPHLKILVTSRPEEDIMTVLHDELTVHCMGFQMQGNHNSTNAKDISKYIDQHLKRILDNNQRRALLEKANGLFIWAATAQKELINARGPEGVERRLQQFLSQERGGDLKALYSDILRQVIGELYASSTCNLLSIVAVLCEPVSITTLSRLVGSDADALERFICSLKSVFRVPDSREEVFLFLHPTFREFLLQLHDSSFAINIPAAHSEVASRTLDQLCTDLRRDICRISNAKQATPNNSDVPDLAKRLEIYASRSLLYSTKFWAHHVAQSVDVDNVMEKAVQFLSTRLLDWTEVMSLNAQLLVGIESLGALRKCVMEIEGNPITSKVQAWCDEAIKMLQSQQGLIEKTALQAHFSLLICLPRNSPLYAAYHNPYETQLPRLLSSSPDCWPNHQILVGHSHSIRCVAFSPNGTRFVSGSDDNTLRLWDSATGASVGKPMQGHADMVTCVAFSPDGTQIVSGSMDSTLCLWDSATGASVMEPMQGHADMVSCVAFSPDGTQIASGSGDDTLRLWDAATGASVGEPMEGHMGSIYCLTFSPDGTLIVSGSDDNTLCLWDSATGTSVGEPMQGHADMVSCVAFSPDGTQIASGSRDDTLRLWDSVTGASVGEPLRGHIGSVYCLAFFPDGTQIISGSEDSTLRLWDSATGASVGEPMQGHIGAVYCVAFSPDGTRIVSGSDDTTLRLWDSGTGASLGEPMRGHASRVACLAFSPGSTRIVSGSIDSTLRIWDSAISTSVGELMRGHTDTIACLAFSPDGTRIASGSIDKTLRLWDSVTGASVGEAMQGHIGSVYCLAFSPDGTIIVSGSDDTTLRIWDSATGASVGEPMQGHTDWVYCLTFSPDGTRIVSGSIDKTLRLWDSATGASVGEPMRGHIGAVHCLAFSPDGTRIVSGSDDNTLRLWDSGTGASLGEPMRGHTSWVACLAFSPDGTWVVSSSGDYTTRLWNTRPSAHTHLLGRQIIGSSAEFIFSLDSSLLHIREDIWRISNQTMEHVDDALKVQFQSFPYASFLSYRKESHAVHILNLQRQFFELPRDFSVSQWTAHRGVIALGATDGRVMIIDCTHLLPHFEQSAKPDIY